MNYLDKRPPQPNFTPQEVDALPMAEGCVADACVEGELIYQLGTTGRWRVMWDDHNGRWCKRYFVPYT